jgi:3-isopropylmalate/(R)-2-methylmalate dehydratase large subunit
VTAMLAFAPRLLWLAADPALVRAQLAGRQFHAAEVPALRHEISTDEISPLPAMVHFDERLGRYPYTGFKTGGELPIGVDAVRAAGIEVVLAGQRYGKGSSREHSVVAERAAGVRLVIAKSFERIYRQNADNLGLLTSTDFGLVERIRSGEAIALDELLAGRDPLAAAIIRAGGLLAYGRERLGPGRQRPAVPAGHEPGAAAPLVAGRDFAAGEASTASDAVIHGAASDLFAGGAPGPQTLFAKIVRRHALASVDTPALRRTGDSGFVRADWRFIHEYYTGMCAHMLDAAYGVDLALHEPQTILAFEDHLSYVHRSPVHVARGLVGDVLGLSRAHRAFVARHGLVDRGYLQPLEAGDPGNTGSQGISHALMAEQYALPGQLIVGTDSHTPHSGALGCVAFGVGTTDMANAFVTGAVRFTQAAVLRVFCAGTLPRGVTAKDLVLHLLALPALRGGAGVGKVFEFAGPVIRAFGIDERATLTNMTAELGGLTGIV